MKKSYALLLTALSAGSITFLIWFIHNKDSPLPIKLEANLIRYRALLACNNLRTLHVENSLGAIKIKAAQAFILQDRTIKATSAIVTLQPHVGKNAIASAKYAELSLANQSYMLYGNVHAKQNTTSLFADKLSFQNNEKILTAEKNVRLHHQNGSLNADKATIELGEKTTTLEGNVTSNFSAKPERIPQQ